MYKEIHNVKESTVKKKSKVRQHFIPQFYLRNFGNKIYCFDKKEERKFSSNPENIAVKSDFYGGEHEGKPSFESILSQIEQVHSKAIRSLLEKKDYYKLNHNEKVSICEFFALQFLRTEYRRNDMKFVYEQMLNLVSRKKLPEYLKVKLTEKAAIGHHLDAIIDYKKYAILFFNMKFITYENHTPIPFWTSDNPITKQNEYDKHPLGNLGITNRGIEMHLSLSPTMSIWAVDPTVFHSLPNTYKTYQKRHIIRENFLQLKFSSRFVYSNTSRFHLIKSMLKDNPHYKDESSTKTEIITGESDKGTIFMTSERNDRWPVNNREVMGKLDTWIEPEIVDKILNIPHDD